MEKARLNRVERELRWLFDAVPQSESAWLRFEETLGRLQKNRETRQLVEKLTAEHEVKAERNFDFCPCCGMVKFRVRGLDRLGRMEEE